MLSLICLSCFYRKIRKSFKTFRLADKMRRCGDWRTRSVENGKQKFGWRSSHWRWLAVGKKSTKKTRIIMEGRQRMVCVLYGILKGSLSWSRRERQDSLVWADEGWERREKREDGGWVGRTTTRQWDGGSRDVCNLSRLQPEREKFTSDCKRFAGSRLPSISSNISSWLPYLVFSQLDFLYSSSLSPSLFRHPFFQWYTPKGRQNENKENNSAFWN